MVIRWFGIKSPSSVPAWQTLAWFPSGGQSRGRCKAAALLSCGCSVLWAGARLQSCAGQVRARRCCAGCGCALAQAWQVFSVKARWWIFWTLQATLFQSQILNTVAVIGKTWFTECGGQAWPQDCSVLPGLGLEHSGLGCYWKRSVSPGRPGVEVLTSLGLGWTKVNEDVPSLLRIS